MERVLNDGCYTLHAYGNDSEGNIAHSVVNFTLKYISTTTATITTLPTSTSQTSTTKTSVSS
ncbi:MAG: hypothetical protein ACFFAU_14515 [Candidatus Hodarchaeota archaeon]